MLGTELTPFVQRGSRDAIKRASKYYFVDVGLASYLRRVSIDGLAGAEAGRALEHFILMELVSFNSYNKRRASLQFWRNKAGQEVDFVINEGELAVEVKITSQLAKRDLKGLAAFCKRTAVGQALVVCCEPQARLIELDSGLTIRALPWKEFLTELWAGELF